MPTAVIETPSVLGHSQVSARRLRAIVAKALHCADVTLTSVDADVVDYPIGSIATGALLRCHGTAIDERGQRRPWSIFVKQLQSARVWPLLHVVPAHLQARWVDEFPWRLEIEAQQSAALDAVLPDGIRKPELYKLVEIDQDHAALWMEDVAVASEPWTIERYVRAARLLGIIAGRRGSGFETALGDLTHARTPGASIREYVLGRVAHGLIPLLSRDDYWAHPALLAELAHAGEISMRSDLVAASRRLEGWLARMNGLPQTLAHGDASPQNLLVPRSEPDTFIVIDWGFTSLASVGFDLGQLLVGLVNVGEVPFSDLAAIVEAIVPAYTDGLVSTGFEATSEQVREGFIVSVLSRSLFCALPLEELDAADSPALRARLRNRIGLTRFLLGLATQVD
jgi:hypothetical protein